MHHGHVVTRVPISLRHRVQIEALDTSSRAIYSEKEKETSRIFLASTPLQSKNGQGSQKNLTFVFVPEIQVFTLLLFVKNISSQKKAESRRCPCYRAVTRYDPMPAETTIDEEQFSIY